MSTKRCLICNQSVNYNTDMKSKPSDLKPIISENNLSEINSPNTTFQSININVKENEKKSTIEDQLKVIFILRELLHIPVYLLENCFRVSDGNNPNLWIDWCKECNEMIQQAYKLFGKLNHIRQKLHKVQKQIVNKIKRSKEISKEFPANPVDNSDRGNHQEIVEIFRQFVKKRKYTKLSTNPFIDGDLEAEILIAKSIPLSVQVKTEPVDDSVSDHEYEPEMPYNSTDPESTDNDIPPKNNKFEVDNPKPKRKRAPRKPLIEYEGAVMGENGKVVFPCQVPGCGKVLKDRRDYQYHKQRHSGVIRPKQEMACDECGIMLPSKNAVYSHKQRIHLGKRRKETEADKKKRREDYKMKKNFEKCPHCEYSSLRWNLQTHIARVHQNVLNYFCEICGKGVKIKSELKYHQAVEHLKCSKEGCNMTFESSEMLREHQLSTYGKEVDVFECVYCKKLFMSATRLKKHLKLHEYKIKVEESGKKKLPGEWICDLCGKDFALKDYLDNHQREMHLGKRKRKKCGKSSTEKGQ